MHEAQDINFKVDIPKQQDNISRKIGKSNSFKFNNPNLEDILSFIDRLQITDNDKKVLIECSKKIPHGALANFRKNYINYLKRNSNK